MDITVSIITHSRPKGLHRLLAALMLQKLDPGVTLDIVVVDNACDEEARRIVEDFAAKSVFPVRYEEEPIKGIVAARNKCVDLFLESDSKHLLFIDDDEWPRDDNWAQRMLAQKQQFAVDIVTGSVLPVSEVEGTEWANHIIHDVGGVAAGTATATFYTSNLLIDREVMARVQPAFDSRFAMTGGSDYHFSLKCHKAGFKAAFVDAPVVEEVPKSRASVRWFLLRGFRSGAGYTRAHMIEEPIVKAVGRCMLMAGVRFARGIGYLLLGLATANKSRLVNGLFRLSSAVGTVGGIFGARHSEYKVIHGN